MYKNRKNPLSWVEINKITIKFVGHAHELMLVVALGVGDLPALPGLHPDARAVLGGAATSSDGGYTWGGGRVPGPVREHPISLLMVIRQSGPNLRTPAQQ